MYESRRGEMGTRILQLGSRLSQVEVRRVDLGVQIWGAGLLISIAKRTQQGRGAGGGAALPITAVVGLQGTNHEVTICEISRHSGVCGFGDLAGGRAGPAHRSRRCDRLRNQ
jgi:hypothetical protein